MNKGDGSVFLGHCVSLKCTPRHPQGGSEEHKQNLTFDNITVAVNRELGDTLMEIKHS